MLGAGRCDVSKVPKVQDSMLGEPEERSNCWMEPAIADRYMNTTSNGMNGEQVQVTQG